ncbi:hypothetical protein P3X46_000253 [Hevea brasiliensis]|uniref:RBR-type E3 ubiquitin transferase n=1 Tax=Hevea brasiliensis TaxID=3981 RepID=A0ABQ9N9E2_HEVBR|nr:E3 ubiquitin-protein ligase RSL1 [Hevea brasiliensis]KAJ9188898.1 hypothetical protein P3X46_000253 [Hevea brasiliensis]
MDDSFESVIEKQLSEISDAKTLHSDIDLAFNLQMEEAITASLSLQPSSSAFNSPLKIASFVSVTNNVDEDDVLHDYTALLLEDIERFDQERRDREACENLMREMREDLDRRIHDQNLANEILNIPDDEWENYGDHYHRPYGDDGGSSSSFPLINELALVNSESFKVYCKGLKSKELIREMNVVVGGVGVAICDSRDNVIFEVSKGLEEDSCGKGKEVSSEEAVQIEALIEGLNAALSLDLKNVTFFCDDFMVYQYVTGRVQPIQNRISTLVNQVSLLQKKFTDCKPSLVARNDVKFAFKLARDAIVSQITWSTESGKGKKSSKETCVICFEDTDVGQMFCVDGCLHRYCFSCMKQHVEVKLLNGMEARCPHEGCKSEVSIDACEKFLDPKLVEIMIQRKKEASIAVPEKVYCPYVKCSSLMSKNEVLEYTNAFVVGAEKSGARKCVKCHYFFCINCKVPWHNNLTCYDYKRSKPPCAEDAMLDSLAKKKLWRQCVNCSHMVELAEGCYHITCRCGYEFCYTCGAPWKNKKATCGCQIWDERNIIRNGQRQ